MIILFGQPDRTLPWLGIIIGVYGMFIHWNVVTARPHDPRHRRAAVSPIHHLKKEHFDKNFAVFFPFWDWLFGTACLPQKGNMPKPALMTAQALNGLAQLLPYPLLPQTRTPQQARQQDSAAASAAQR